MYPNLFDADDEAIGRWEHNGVVVDLPANATKQWLTTHKFLWCADPLRTFIKQHQPLILFGVSDNTFDFIDFFDQVFFLHAPCEKLLERVQHDSRSNPLGKTEEHRKIIELYYKEDCEQARAHNIPFIDATQSPEKILADILSPRYLNSAVDGPVTLR